MEFPELSRRAVLTLFSTAAAATVVGCASVSTQELVGSASRDAWQAHSVRSETDGLDIIFHVAGDGPPLLIVHGGGSNAAPYLEFADVLKSRFQVARIERRNYAVSGSRRSPITWEQEIGDVAAVVRELGGRTHLSGHSAGGLVSLQVARHRPELINKLALYEPPLLGGGGESVIAIKRSFEELIAQDRRDDALVLLYGHFVGMPEDVVRETVRQRGSAIYPLLSGAIADMEALIALDTDPQNYAGITLQTLLLVGETSAAHPLLDSSVALARVLPNVQTARLAGQGHSAQVSAPLLLAETLAPFFQRS